MTIDLIDISSTLFEVHRKTLFTAQTQSDGINPGSSLNVEVRDGAEDELSKESE